MYYSAIVATAASLVSNLVYWNFVQPKKEDMSALKQQLLQSEDAAKESQLSALAVAEEYEQSYTKFIDSIRN